MNWRDINQNQGRRPTTAVARKRKWKGIAQLSLAVTVIVASVAGLVTAITYSSQLIGHIQIRSNPTPLRTVTVLTDGMLNREWFVATFPEVLQTSPLNLDIAGLQQQLEQNGQIQRARVSIILPDTLQITLQERQPVLRVRVRDGNGTVNTLLIASDGTVFNGFGYPAATLQRLPVAADLRLRRSDGVFLPIQGMDTITRLLDTAKTQVPHLVSDWQTIHFTRFQQDLNAPDAQIVIGSRQVREIVFAPDNFEDQLLRLREVVAFAAQENRGTMRRIDLSFKEKAIVQFN